MFTFVTVVHTYRVQATKKTAEAFRLALALEKGYSSRLERIKGGWRVIASDNQAVDFLRPGATFGFSAPGRPEVSRDEATTDELLREALGDTALTTSRLMDLASGALGSLTFTYRGVEITVRKL